MEKPETREAEKKSEWKNITPAHERLWIWQKAHKLHLEIYKICNTLPSTETYKLKGQIERSSKSVKDNIAEGNESYYFNDKKKGFYTSRKEAAETQSHIRELEDKGYIEHSIGQGMIDEYEEIKRGINGMVRRISEKKDLSKQKGSSKT